MNARASRPAHEVPRLSTPPIDRSAAMFVAALFSALLAAPAAIGGGADRAGDPAADGKARRAAGTQSESPQRKTPAVYGYRVIKAYPHDPGAFTQGLVYEQGRLFESTGLLGQSSVREVELETGRIRRSLQLAPDLFGEGITSFDDRLIQLTLDSKLGIVYDRRELRELERFPYDTYGWGITHDGRRLIMSDGSATLHLLDPASFKPIGKIEVRDEKGPVAQLNELEYVRGEILANVWLTDRIARIAPDSGRVTGWIDLSGLARAHAHRSTDDVLNGIAYDAANDRLFVTGKRWGRLYEIKLVPSPPDRR